MGAVFGVTSVIGPLLGGVITGEWGWRWLFFASLPLGLVALAFIARYLRPPHTPRTAVVDVWGIVLLTLALIALLLGTSWGGVTFPWLSWQVLGAFGLGAVLILILVPVELRAVEPVIPMRLFRDSTFVISNVASLAVGIVMFGALCYVPVYAQGVMGVDVTTSGAIVMPMSVAMIATSIAIGLLITRTGRYKAFMVVAMALLTTGYVLLSSLSFGDSPWRLVVAMAVVGMGLGGGLSTYVLVVQNTAPPGNLGVATSAVQSFRSAGGPVGSDVFGTVWASRIGAKVDAHLPPGTALPPEGADAGAVLDPARLAALPAPVVEAIRRGLGDALHDVFVIGIPLAALALAITLFLKVIPLRDTLHTAPATDTVRKALDNDGAGGPAEDAPLGSGSGRPSSPPGSDSPRRAAPSSTPTAHPAQSPRGPTPPRVEGSDPGVTAGRGS